MKIRKKILSTVVALGVIMTSLPTNFLAQEIEEEQNLKEYSNVKITTSDAVEPILNVYQGDGYKVEFNIVSEWEEAFQGEVILTNTSDKILENWIVGFDFEQEITNIWNADIISHEGESYIIKNKGYNQDIAPHESIYIGFEAKKQGIVKIPSEYNLLNAEEEINSEDYMIDFKILNAWGESFNGEISITNSTEKTIEDWILEFDYDGEIEQFATAEILAHNGNHYIVKNRGYNADITQGQTLTLWFSGRSSEPEAIPINYVLKHMGKIVGDSDTKLVVNQDEDHDGGYVVGTNEIVLTGQVEGTESITEVRYELTNADDKTVQGIAKGTKDWEINNLPITIGQNQVQIKAMSNSRIATEQSLVIDYVSTRLTMAEGLYVPTKEDAKEIKETTVGVWRCSNLDGTESDNIALLVQVNNALLEALEQGELTEGQIVFIPNGEDYPVPFAKRIVGYGNLSDDIDYNDFNSNLRETYPYEEYDDDLYKVIYVTEASFRDLFVGDIHIIGSQIDTENPIAFSSFDSILEEEEGKERSVYARRSSSTSRGQFFLSQIKKGFAHKPKDENGAASLMCELNDVVVYDEDQNLKTTNDQMKLIGEFGINNLRPQFIYTWKNTILPKKIDLTMSCSKVVNLGAKYEGKLSIEDLIEGLPKFDSKRDLELSVFDYTVAEGKVEGVDMSNNIVLGCIGYNVVDPALPVAIGYKVTDIEGYSEDYSLIPVVVVMLSLNLEGKIECSTTIAYNYSETYSAGITVADSEVIDEGNDVYDDVYDLPLGKSVGLHSKPTETTQTFYIESKGEVASTTEVEGQVCAMLGGIIPATIGMGGRMGVTAKMNGRVDFLPTLHALGDINARVGLDAFARFKLRVKAEAGSAQPELKHEKDFPYPLYEKNFKWSSEGLQGRVYDDFTKEMSNTEAIKNVELTADPKRKGLVDVNVIVRDKKTGQEVAREKTDKNGNYKINTLKDGDYTVIYKKYGYTERTTDITVSSATPKVYVSMNRKKYDMSGCIRDTNNNIVPNAEIKIVPKENYITPEKVITADANGKFEIKGLIAGVYEIYVTKAGYLDGKWDKSKYFEQPLDLKIAKCSGAKFHGRIVKADEDTDMLNNEPIKDVVVKIFGMGENKGVYQAQRTNADGKYIFTDLPQGEYHIVIYKSGYMTIDEYVTIEGENTITYNLALELISNFCKGYGTIQGTIKDATSGAKILRDLQIFVRKGINNTKGDICANMIIKNGVYTMVLPAGNYTLQVQDISTGLPNESIRYMPGTINVKVLGNKTIRNQDGVLSTRVKDGQIRIVLNWGANPSDLDSHLVGPGNIAGDKLHVYYASKVYNNGRLNANLDVDDRSSYGPETITLTNPITSRGNYHYYVHDFSNKNQSASSKLSISNATVKVYTSNSSKPKIFSVPTYPGTGTLWKVFEYNPNTQEIIPVNIMKSISIPSNIVDCIAVSNEEDTFDEEILEEIIAEDIAKAEK